MPSSTGSSVPSSSLISLIAIYAASAGASATMTSLNAEAPRNRLLELVSKVLCRKQKAHQRVFQSMRRAIFQSTRCARFGPDGKFVATGSSEASVKLFEVSKIKQMMLAEARDGPVRPVICTFDDHLQPINDLDFHPQNTSVLISGSKDRTIKFFDFYKMTAKRAFKVSWFCLSSHID